MTSALSKRSEILIILVAFVAHNFNCLVRDLAIFQLKCNEQYPAFQKVKKESLATFS